MVKFDPPWRLDPLKNIINVGWGGSIARIIFEYSISQSGVGSPPTPTWSAAFVSDAGGGNLTEEIGPVVTPPGPPTAEVTSKNNFWSYKRERKLDTVTTTQTIHVTDIGIYGVICDGGVVSSFSDPILGQQVPFIIDNTRTGVFNEGGMDIYGTKNSPDTEHILQLVMNSVATRVFGIGVLGSVRAYLQSETSGHSITGFTTQQTLSGNTITFVNLPRIAQNSQGAKEFVLTATMEGATSSQSLNWDIRIFVHLGIKTFDAFGDPTVANVPVGSGKESATIFQEVAAPPVEVKFTIDLLTYKVTTTRRNL